MTERGRGMLGRKEPAGKGRGKLKARRDIQGEKHGEGDYHHHRHHHFHNNIIITIIIVIIITGGCWLHINPQ